MKRLIWIIPILFLLGTSSAAAQDDSSDISGRIASLRILEIPGSVQSRETLYRDFHVLDDLGDILVALPRASDPELLEREKIASRVIEIPAGSGSLYIVSLKGLTIDQVAGKALVLYAGNDIAIVAADDKARAELERHVLHFGLMHGIRPLNLDRIAPTRAFETPLGWKEGSRAADPRITAMVAQVSAANIQNTVQDLQNMGERFANSGAHIAETYLVNEFNSIGGLSVSTHNFSGTYSENVIAELPGTVDPSVIYMVGSHYDSYSYSGSAPGADDNASGTAGVVEIARILSQHQFKYTLRFGCWSAEELGLVGSWEYCDDLVTWGDNVAAYINLDMTAYRAAGDPLSVDFVTNYSSGTLISFCSDMYATYVPSIAVNQGSMSGGTSDHQSFTQHGFTACFPFEDLGQYSPYIHTPNDVIGTSANDFNLAELITEGALASLATLASPLDIEISHTPLVDTTDASGPYRVIADVTSLIGAGISSVTLTYDLGSGFVSKNMVFSGSGDEYISSIPGLAGSGYVKYYIEAVDDQGNTERLPDGLGAENFEFFVGYFNDIFADDFEISDNGWTHGGTGQDDWMRDVPTGNGGYDPSYAWSGAKIWGNDLGPAGWNGNYQPNVNNWLESPDIDCSGETGVHLRYRRWLTVEKGQYDQAKILVDGNEVFANAYGTDHIDTSWVAHEIDISAYADNNPGMNLRYTLTTDGGLEMGGWNLDDLHVGTPADGDMAALHHSEVYVQAAAGGSIVFTLNGTPAQAGRDYILALSGSGTTPGTYYGSVHIPLNPDSYTNYGLAHLNTPVFDDFAGTLDGSGDAQATFNVPVITNPALVGQTLSFAWVTNNPVDYASNPVDLLIVP